MRAVPPLGAIDRGIREQRATVPLLARPLQRAGAEDRRAPADVDIERDPGLLLVAANAAYRDAGAGRTIPAPCSVSRGCSASIPRCSGRGPWQYDAAYNYEFLARRRDALDPCPKGQKPGQRGRQAAAPALPPHTLHGRPGDVPPGADMNEFKVIVPQRSDERREQPEAGKGGPKARKG